MLGGTIAAISPPDAAAERAARERLDRMTKPTGSLGVLEDVAAQLAGIAGVCPAPLPAPATVAVFAGDHGVHAQGVTPWPQEVTAQMVANFLAGGAVVRAATSRCTAGAGRTATRTWSGPSPGKVSPRRTAIPATRSSSRTRVPCPAGRRSSR